MMQESGVESGNALGSEQCYHSSLRIILLKIQEDLLQINWYVVLKNAVKSTKETIVPIDIYYLY